MYTFSSRSKKNTYQAGLHKLTIQNEQIGATSSFAVTDSSETAKLERRKRITTVSASPP